MRHLSKDLFITAAVAAATMVGALALFAPTGVDAGRGKKRTVRAKGVEMSLRTTRTTREPTAELTLVNTTGETVQVTPRIALFTEAPGSEFARMVSPPRQRWMDEELYVLAPHESQTVAILPGKKIPARSLAWFTLRAGKRQTETPAFVARAERKPGELARKKSNKRAKVAKQARRPAKRAKRNAAPVAQMAFLD